MKILDSLLLAVLTSTAAWAQNAPSIYEGSTPVTSVAHTAYSGEQTITCAKLKDGTYALYDPTRNVYTVDASFAKLIKNGMPLEQQQNFNNAFFTDQGEWFEKSFLASAPITSASSTWNLDPCVLQMDALDVRLLNYDKGYFGNSPIYIEITESNGQKYNTEKFTYDGSDKDITIKLPHTITSTTAQWIQAVLVIEGPEGSIRSTPATVVHSSQYVDVREQGQIDDFGIYACYHVHGSLGGMQAALDAHYDVACVMDYYKAKFNRNSFDGNGSPVVNLVNAQCGMSQTSMAKHFASSPYGYITIGMGSGELMGETVDEGLMFLKPCAGVQVLAHEFTHLVNNKFTEVPSCLALAESFADIMSLNVYRHVLGEKIWYLGGNFMPEERPIMRRFDKPAEMEMAECYNDEFFNEDDPYSMSTVQSHMYYLLVEGGSGVNSLGETYAVTPISPDDAEALVYETLTSSDFFNVDYPACRDRWIETASKKWGAGSSQVESLKQAWTAVGLKPEADAIADITAENARQTDILYNTLGQRISSTQHAVFIKNGKKFVK